LEKNQFIENLSKLLEEKVEKTQKSEDQFNRITEDENQDIVTEKESENVNDSSEQIDHIDNAEIYSESDLEHISDEERDCISEIWETSREHTSDSYESNEDETFDHTTSYESNEEETHDHTIETHPSISKSSNENLIEIVQTQNTISPVKTKLTPFTDLTNRTISISSNLNTASTERKIKLEFYKKLGPKIDKIALFHDPGATGIERIGKTISKQTVGCVLLSIQNRIESKKEIPSENWIKKSATKKLKNIDAKITTYQYFLHFAMIYYITYIHSSFKWKNRPIEHQILGIYENIESLADFLQKPKQSRIMSSFRTKKKPDKISES